MFIATPNIYGLRHSEVGWLAPITAVVRFSFIDQGRHSETPNIERTPMLHMKLHKETNKRHSLSQIGAEVTHGAYATSDPRIRMLPPVFTLNIRGMVAAYLCHVFVFVVCSEVIFYVMFCFIRVIRWNLSYP